MNKTDFSKLKVGSRLSETQYYEVIEIKKISLAGAVKVCNERGFEFHISEKIVEEGMYSADQYNQELPCSKTEAIEVLINAKDCIFTVSFNKMPDEKTVADTLVKNAAMITGDSKALKKFAKDVVKGEERILTGYLLSTEPHFGRSTVVDLSIPKEQNRVRQVDHRNINFIIYQNKKYICK